MTTRVEEPKVDLTGFEINNPTMDFLYPDSFEPGAKLHRITLPPQPKLEGKRINGTLKYAPKSVEAYKKWMKDVGLRLQHEFSEELQTGQERADVWSAKKRMYEQLAGHPIPVPPANFDLGILGTGTGFAPLPGKTVDQGEQHGAMTTGSTEVKADSGETGG